MLTTCPECGKPISDQARACPQCGYPLAPEPLVEYQLYRIQRRQWLAKGLMIVGVALVILGVLLHREKMGATLAANGVIGLLAGIIGWMVQAGRRSQLEELKRNRK